MKEGKLIEQLEEFRLENRITQEALAERIGVAFVTVSRWLNGHTRPSKIHEYHIRKLLSAEGKKK